MRHPFGANMRGIRIHAKAPSLNVKTFFRPAAYVPALILCVAGTVCAEEAQTKPLFKPVSGIVVPMGGAVRFSNDAVRQKLVELSGGKGARWVVIPTSSRNPVKNGQRAADELRRRGAETEVLPIAPMWPGETLETARRAAADPALVAKIRAANGVFFTGGAQERYVDTLAPGGVESPVLKAVREVQARGGVIAGTSAGTAIMSQTMFRDAQNALNTMKGQLREGKEVDVGFGFLGPDLFIDQHFLRRGRFGRMLALMIAKGYRIGLGVDEDTAAVIRGLEIEIVGVSGALLMDLREAEIIPAGGAVNVRNVRVSYLDKGDRYDLAKMQAEASATKRGEIELKFGASGFAGEYENSRSSYTDMLGDSALPRALAQLVDGRDEVVKGLAFDATPRASDPFPDMGFEFTLRRDAKTRGWYSGADGAEDYSVFNARLDVRPIRMANPIYKAW